MERIERTERIEHQTHTHTIEYCKQELNSEVATRGNVWREKKLIEPINQENLLKVETLSNCHAQYGVMVIRDARSLTKEAEYTTNSPFTSRIRRGLES